MVIRTRKSCRLCRQKDILDFWVTPNYHLKKCLNCGLVWDPFPSDNPLKQYQKEYFINENPKGGYANYFAGMQINRKTFADRLKAINRKTGVDGKVLDVGCALGDCLKEAEKMGWQELYGIDPSAYACRLAQNKGLTVKKGTLKTVKFAPNSFALIMLQDAIEHLTDPLEELQRIYRLLKPGGWIFIVTPDIEGLWSKILNSKWYHYKPQEHLIYFSKKSMRMALESAGFAKIQTKAAYHIMSLEYILNRLCYYWPSFFTFLLKTTSRLPIKKIPFRIYTGELEAWGQKPFN